MEPTSGPAAQSVAGSARAVPPALSEETIQCATRLVSAQLGAEIAAKMEQIDNWSSLAGGLGDEDCEMTRALESARTGLGPLLQIAALPEATQESVIAMLRGKGLTPDKLFDLLLFDDAAAAAARVRLRRERVRLQIPWPDVWAGATMVNALGQSVAATQMVTDKHVLLLLAAGRSEACEAFMPKLMEVHAELSASAAPVQIVLVSCDRTEAEMVRFHDLPQL